MYAITHGAYAFAFGNIKSDCDAKISKFQTYSKGKVHPRMGQEGTDRK